MQQRAARGARAGGLLLGGEHVGRARPRAAAQHDRLPALLLEAGHLHLEQLEEVLARMVGREARVHPGEGEGAGEGEGEDEGEGEGEGWG